MRDEAGLLGIVLAMTLVGWCLRGGHADASAQPVAVTDTSLLVASVAPGEVGPPVYPGATPVGHATRQVGAGWSLGQVLLHSTDTFAQVVAWYDHELPDATRHDLNDAGGASAVYQRRADGVHDTVRVYPAGEGTRILLYRRHEEGG